MMRAVYTITVLHPNPGVSGGCVERFSLTRRRARLSIPVRNTKAHTEMDIVSMRLPEDLLREVDRRSAELNISRADYVRRALLAMNRAVLAEQRKARLRAASLRVRAESIRVNAEFAAIERAPD